MLSLTPGQRSLTSNNSHMSVGNSSSMGGRFPSDLENVSLGSMKDKPLSSFDRERIKKEILEDEGMDFEDDSSRSSGE